MTGQNYIVILAQNTCGRIKVYLKIARLKIASSQATLSLSTLLTGNIKKVGSGLGMRLWYMVRMQ